MEYNNELEKEKKMKKLSVALATFNEEKNLAACLKAVKDWVGEIVVVDGSSTDQTRNIAKQYGAKVIKTTNPAIFHINKQKAIDECQGDWILQLDADEIVTPALRKEIEGVIKQKKSLAAYFLPRRTTFLGQEIRKGGLYPDAVIRLFQKGKARLPCQSVHEQMRVEGEVGYLKNELIHFPFPDFHEYLVKANRYSSLLAEEYRQKAVGRGAFAIFKYVFFVPKITFLKLYCRHLGFLDGFPGFVFALFSAIQKIMGYVKYWEKGNEKKINQS
jgi:glycosyltransferase involved in cell wall biosynthesis